MSTLEAIFKANNARVKVDFKGGPEMINLIERGLDDLFRDLPPDAVEAGRAILDGCDLTVNAAADGTWSVASRARWHKKRDRPEDNRDERGDNLFFV